MEENKNKIINTCYYAFFINGLIALLFGSIMHNLLGYYNLGYEFGSVLLSMQSIGNLIASFIAGFIVSKIGPRESGLVFLGILVVGLLSTIIFDQAQILPLAFLFIGLARGSISNISNTVVNKITNKNPSKLNILHTFFAVGAFILPFLASINFKLGYNWRNMIYMITALSTIGIFKFYRMEIDNRLFLNEVKSEESFKARYGLEFIMACLIAFFYIGAEYAVNGWIVTYLIDTGLMTDTMSQITLSLLWLVIIFGRLFTASLLKRIDSKKILFFNSLGVLLLFIVFLNLKNIYGIIISILLIGFFLSGIYPTTIGTVGHIIDNSHLATGILLGISGLGGILVPYITGIVASRKGIAGGMLVVQFSIVVLFILTSINLIIDRRKLKIRN